MLEEAEICELKRELKLYRSGLTFIVSNLHIPNWDNRMNNN